MDLAWKLLSPWDMNLYNFNPAEVLNFLLTFIRISLVLFVLPFFGGQFTPTAVKAALCLILALVLAPTVHFPIQAMPSNIWSLSVMILGELTLGLILNLAVTVLFAAVQTGGSFIGFQMGFTMVTAADPMNGTSEDLCAYLLYMVTLMIFLSMNGHLFLLKAFSDSFATVPPGGLYLSPELARRLLEFTSQIFVLAVKISSPVLVSVFLVDLAIAIISRAAPEMNFLAFGFPVKILVGFVFFGMLLSLMDRTVSGFIVDLGDLCSAIFTMGRNAG